MSCSTVMDHDLEMPTDRGTLGKGHMIFTGPDSHRNHRVSPLDGVYTGQESVSPEKTSDLNYLCRGPEDHIPNRKSSSSAPYGSIGWGLPSKQDFRVLDTGHQIKIGEPGPFRQRTEDKYTHRLQEPYYPKPVAGPATGTYSRRDTSSVSSAPLQYHRSHLPRIDSAGSMTSINSSRPSTARKDN